MFQKRNYQLDADRENRELDQAMSDCELNCGSRCLQKIKMSRSEAILRAWKTVPGPGEGTMQIWLYVSKEREIGEGQRQRESETERGSEIECIYGVLVMPVRDKIFNRD